MNNGLLTEKHQGEFLTDFSLKNTTEMINNAVARLPEEMNNKKTHFILELIRSDEFNKAGEWNLWLRDSIAELFANAVEEMKRKNDFLTDGFHFLPLKDEAQDEFFNLIVDQIYAKIRQMDCILAESGRLTAPGRVFTASPEIRELISGDDIRLIFEMEFVSPEIKADEKLLWELGVAEFTHSHLLECLSCTEWLSAKSDQWMAQLYIYLNRHGLDRKYSSAFHSLKTIRMSDGTQASPAAGKVFFPFDASENYCFEKDLPFCSSTILQLDNREKNIRHFLENTGVRKPASDEIIRDFIIPFFHRLRNTSASESNGKSIHPDYIRFIKEAYINHVRETSAVCWNLMEDVRNSILLRVESSNGCEYRKADEIYLSRTYSGNGILEKLFSGIDGINFIHTEYLTPETEQTTGNNPVGKISEYRELRRKAKPWQTFFTALGIENKPRVTAGKNNIYETSQTPDWFEGRQYMVWNEQTCPDMEKVLETGTKEQKSLLYRQIEKHAAEYSEKITTKYTYKPKRGILECHGGKTKTRFGRLVEGMKGAL
ncbi:MAG: hypothetical protein LWY06_06400 [Firmicutes bacterium]|nr:hypothetical protein [Bacillota bacterium]